MKKQPYQNFGKKFKEIRIKAKESLFDVSGAVEADPLLLESIESGLQQPSEDLVLLLISHFALKDDEALNLWELAGYKQDKTGTGSIYADESGVVQKAFVTAGDARVLYTDMVHIKSNRYGVVINFLQSLGAEDHTVAVSRIGMSLTHAESLLEVLTQTINESKKQQKMLDSSDNKKESK
ncbi:MAG: DUF3467 domain-containing protein [Patescibacteria group bacterium]|jgi:hypothetical protein|nr:DUF3467 domain-containing protein [Patescibacteria group bacterium]